MPRATAPPNAELEEFLRDSARYGDTDDVRTAIKEGVAVDAVDEDGRSGALCVRRSGGGGARVVPAVSSTAAAAWAAKQLLCHALMSVLRVSWITKVSLLRPNQTNNKTKPNTQRCTWRPPTGTSTLWGSWSTPAR
jgi:hypothetical protein